MLIKILTFEFFSELYQCSKSCKFILSQECFRCIFYLFENAKINKKIFNDFLNNNSVLICELINSSINKTENKENSYYMIRESLLIYEKILCSPHYEKFNEYFSNNTYNLKTTMKQLNNPNLKIKIQATVNLYHFFLDIETKDKAIRQILNQNKQGFYKFFQNNEDLFTDDNDLMEKKFFILYEL